MAESPTDRKKARSSLCRSGLWLKISKRLEWGKGEHRLSGDSGELTEEGDDLVRISAQCEKVFPYSQNIIIMCKIYLNKAVKIYS